MKYRVFPKTGEKISQLGFGAMRLPTIKGSGGKVDIDEASRLIRHAIDNGVNYVDTAYVYHNEKGEEAVAAALKDGYRDRVSLADKLPLWMADDLADVERIFETQLRRLDTDRIDFYLAHNMEEVKWRKFHDLDIWEFFKGKQAEGLIKNVGFSYHGATPELFKEMLDSYPWDFCQIQFNYMDMDYQAGVEGLKYAGSKGVPVIVMEPLKGGQLTDLVPPAVQKIWDGSGIKRSPADWAFRWVADFPEVLLILSGMSNFSQVEENLKILSEAGPGCLTADERAAIEMAAAEYNRLIPYPCTRCHYCMPCPQGLDIPERITDRNEAEIYMAEAKIGATVRAFARPLPSDCVECRECEDKCPQHLPIAQIMKECAEMFER